MKALYNISIAVVLLLTVCNSLSAQKADLKNSMIPKGELPKLEKVMIFGDEKGVTKAPDKESFGMHISDTEATNRATSDGKISRKEARIIDRAKRMPQDQ